MSSPSEHSLWCGSTRWAYQVRGHGARALLVLGPPLLQVSQSFERSGRVIVASLPPVDSVLQLTDGLLRLLERELLEQVDLYGHGIGAALAHAFIRRYPDRIDRLALSGFGLCSTSHARRVRWAARLRERVSQRAHRDAERARLAVLADLLRHRDRYRVDEPVLRPGKVLVALDPDDRGFTLAEQHALVRAYPGAIATYTAGHQLERKLEFFFRVRAHLIALPGAARSA